VLIPAENEKDLADIPENIKDKLDIRTVKWIDEVLEVALERSPLPQSAARDPDGAPATGKATTEVATATRRPKAKPKHVPH
jgi:ATP-dependent Lon protease